MKPTGYHKFYSDTRKAWVSASQLDGGERLRGVNGPVTVVAVRRIPGIKRVYNMTVEGEHVYHVSAFGVLVHNECPPEGENGLPPNGAEGPPPNFGQGPPPSIDPAAADAVFGQPFQPMRWNGPLWWNLPPDPGPYGPDPMGPFPN
ncbi:MAG: Hint domain-containing protein [Pirellulales bacterium]